MTKRNVRISTGTLDQFGEDFIKAWKQGEQGIAEEIQAEHVCFLDLSTMVNALTEKRLEILKTLQRHPGISIYELAKQLNRHYKNVHTDVGLLKDVGLIEVGEDRAGLCVPFTKIQAEINLAA